MFLELFLVGSLAFWILLSSELIFLFYCVAWRKGGLALASVLLVLLACQFLGDIPVFIYIWNNPFKISIYSIIYLCGAVIWGVVKWYLFVKDNHFRYMEMFNEWCEKNNIDPREMTLQQKSDWKYHFDSNWGHRYAYDYEYKKVEFRPDVSSHRSDIITWMTFWPWSLLWTLLNDPLTKLFNYIYYSIASSLKSIRDYVWKGTEGHMLTKEEEMLLNAQREEEYRKKQEQLAEQV